MQMSWEFKGRNENGILLSKDIKSIKDSQDKKTKKNKFIWSSNNRGWEWESNLQPQDYEMTLTDICLLVSFFSSSLTINDTN